MPGMDGIEATRRLAGSGRLNPNHLRDVFPDLSSPQHEWLPC